MKTDIKENLSQILKRYQLSLAPSRRNDETDLLFAFAMFLVIYQTQSNLPLVNNLNKKLSPSIDAAAVHSAITLFSRDFPGLSQMIEHTLENLKPSAIDELFRSLKNLVSEPSIEPDEIMDCTINLLNESKSITGYIYTPTGICKLISKIVSAQNGDRIADIYSRSGEMLKACTANLKKAHVCFQAEMQNLNVIYTKMRLYFQANLDVEPIFLSSGTNYKANFDIIITNPPFARLGKNESCPSNDETKNFDTLESFFLFKSYQLLNARGKAAIIVPAGLLSRGNKEKRLRETLTMSRSIKSIISLPHKAFLPFTSIAANIILLDKSKQYEYIRFIDMRNLLDLKNLNENFFKELKSLIESSDMSDVAASIPLDTIANNDFNWECDRYLKKTDAYKPRYSDVIKQELLQREKELMSVQNKIDYLISEMQKS